MNGLTLRISSDNKNRPLRNDVEKEDISSIFNFNNEYATLEYSPHGFDKLLLSSTPEEQVKSLKETFKCLLEETEVTETVYETVNALIHMFLSLRPKSILFPPILKFLSTVPDELFVPVEESLLRQLKLKLTEPILAPQAINDHSVILLTCLENKSLSRFDFSSCREVILSYIVLSLAKCDEYYQSETVPVKKLDIINALHSCVQAAICISQKFQLSEPRVLIDLSIKIISDVELPINNRSAASILTVHLAKHFAPDYWLELLKGIVGTEDVLSILCYCFGLVVVLKINVLESEIILNGKYDYVINHLYFIVAQIEEENASDSSVVLAATRCISQISKALTSIDFCMSGMRDIIDPLLAHIWSHIEHFMDAVRHLSNESLFNVQIVALKYPELGIFNRIMGSLKDLSVERRSKHAAISILIEHVPVATILAESPGLADALRTAALGNPPSNYAIKTLESMIIQDYYETTKPTSEPSPIVKWYKRWVPALLSSELCPALERLFTSIIKIHHPVIQSILHFNMESNSKELAVVLTCLKIGKNLKLIDGEDDDFKWKQSVDIDYLQECMWSYDDNVRLSCLALIVDSTKSTQPFSYQEVELIKTFYSYNLRIQDPAFRQKSLAWSKKFFKRFKDSEAAKIRSLKKQREYSNCPQCEHDDPEELKNQEYSQAPYDILYMCLESLFPGASPARRSFAFGLLSLTKEFGFWAEAMKDCDTSLVQKLMFCLLDSYEENKLIAKQLLASCPDNLLQFDIPEHVEKYVEETLALSSSIRPPDSISAAYYMSLIASFDGLWSDLKMPFSSYYHCLSVTLDALERDLAVAKESLLKAACSGPLYGRLFVIRHLLQEVFSSYCTCINVGRLLPDLPSSLLTKCYICVSEIDSSEEWRMLLKRILEVAFDCNNVVANVVYNSSPEGHLPMDFSYNHIKDESDPQVTSQMVLLCSWRTVKEVSLLLGDIAEGATITGQHSAVIGLISEEQILAMGKHLIELLSETKHRGAFEQAYLGFSKLTAKLWRCDSLYELPRKWLEETLNCITSNENLSATRRSAGIPFIVQALICSELISGSNQILHSTMAYLLRLSKGDHLEGRVHALNILRALYRGSSLGETVGPFVAEGIATAIAGFNAGNWAERNSSTLLLSALMSRVFGVPRGKSETLCWRNKMTGRLFFLRYPTLYSELLTHLEESSENDMYPALYPVLLLLGRLYPSSLEGTDSNLQLLNYLPHVLRCSESSILKTRKLAATAVSSLIPSTSYIEYISKFLADAKLVQKENHRHGLLLMALKLVQEATTSEDINKNLIKNSLDTWLVSLLDIINSSQYSFISKDASIQIILYLTESYFVDIPISYRETLKDILVFSYDDDSIHYGCEFYKVHKCLLLFILNYKGNEYGKIIENFIELLKLPDYDVRSVTLQFLNFVLCHKSHTFVPEMHESLKLTFDITDDSYQLVDRIKNTKELGNILLELLLYGENHHEDSAKLLKNIQYFPNLFRENGLTVQRLYDLCKESPPIISCQAINCLNAFLSYQISSHILPKDLEIAMIISIVDEFSSPNSDDACRMAVADLLTANQYVLMERSSSITILEIWISLVRLILDEVDEIRAAMCSRLSDNALPSKVVEILLERFVDEMNTRTAVVGLLYLAVGDKLTDSDDEEFDDTCVFEKGATNTYYEEIELSWIASDHLRKLKKQYNDILDLKFDPLHTEWLSKKTGISGDHLREFVENYKNSPKPYNENIFCNCLPHKPSETKNLMKMHKLKRLLEVFCD